MDPQTRTLKCPNCAGEAKPDSVRCEWCGSAAATSPVFLALEPCYIGMRHAPVRIEAAREEVWACRDHALVGVALVIVGG
jgi:hypothetical protein